MRPKRDMKLSQVCVCYITTKVHMPTIMLVDYSQHLEASGVFLMISMTFLAYVQATSDTWCWHVAVYKLVPNHWTRASAKSHPVHQMLERIHSSASSRRALGFAQAIGIY